MKHTTWSAGLSVSADGTGVVAHAGSIAVRLLADRSGLTRELGKATARRSFAPVHDRGQVLVDVAVMLADGMLRRDPTMAQILDSHQPYRRQLERIDALLLGPSPTTQRRIALAFAGGGIMTIGAPGLDGPLYEVRAGLIATMTRALDTDD